MAHLVIHRILDQPPDSDILDDSIVFYSDLGSGSVFREESRPSMIRVSYLILCVCLFTSGAPVIAGGHLWDINELYSNFDGTIQFVELHVPMASSNEIIMANKWIRSSATLAEFVFPENLTGSTSFAHLLIATQGFANLPGAPTPDYILPDNFMAVSGDTVTWFVYDAWTYPTPALPIDGVMSIQKDLATGQLIVAANTPTNFSGVSGSVDAGGPPPVPTASFSIDVTSGDHPLDVVFTDTSTGIVDSWSWDFGDSNGSTSQSPAHTYTSAGVYTITLTATNVGGSDTSTCTDCITVADPPPPPSPDFVRGDTNQDNGVDISDPIFLLTYLFASGAVDCLMALDSNDDNNVDLGDAIFLLTFIFGGGASPDSPFPDCGQDLTPGGVLDCAVFSACP